MNSVIYVKVQGHVGFNEDPCMMQLHLLQIWCKTLIWVGILFMSCWNILFKTYECMNKRQVSSKALLFVSALKRRRFTENFLWPAYNQC